nr:cupin domain-containing protein [Pseudoflavonifractor sp. MSJ-30]
MKEVAHHGNPEFPLGYYVEDIWEFDFHCVDWHWHPEVEVIYVLEGTATVLAGSGSYRLSAGTAAFLNTQVIHCFRGGYSGFLPGNLRRRGGAGLSARGDCPSGAEQPQRVSHGPASDGAVGSNRQSGTHRRQPGRPWSPRPGPASKDDAVCPHPLCRQGDSGGTCRGGIHQQKQCHEAVPAVSAHIAHRLSDQLSSEAGGEAADHYPR